MDDGGYTTRAEQNGPYGDSDWHCASAPPSRSPHSHTHPAVLPPSVAPGAGSALYLGCPSKCVRGTTLVLIFPAHPCAGYAFNRHDAWTNMHDWGCFNWNWVRKMHRREDPNERDKYFL